MYAVVQEGTKQFKVTSGDMLLLDRHVEPDEKTITLDQVLLVAGEGQPRIGLPLVAGATVTAEVLGPELADKVYIHKYRRRKGFHKKIGHRQEYTRIRVTSINA